MSRPERGTIDIQRARAIKQALVGGATPGQVAKAESLPYMVVYRIATGETWQSVDGQAYRTIPNRVKQLTPELRDQIYMEKRGSGESNAKVAASLGLSESMVARAVRDARILLAARVQRLRLTSGDDDMAISQYGLSPEEADELVAWATDNDVPEHLRSELSED